MDNRLATICVETDYGWEICNVKLCQAADLEAMRDGDVYGDFDIIERCGHNHVAESQSEKRCFARMQKRLNPPHGE